MAPPKESPLYGSRCLPSEEEMREIIGSMVIPDPYGLPDMPTVASLLQEIETGYQAEMADYAEALKEWEADNDPLAGDKPDEPTRKLPDFQKMVPAYSFRDDSVARTVVAKNEDTKDVENSYRYRYRGHDEEEKHWLETLSNTDLRQLISTSWPASFIEEVNQSCDAALGLYTGKIQRGSELSYAVKYSYDNFLSNMAQLQRAMLVVEMRKAGHIRTLGEPDLRSEIRLRRKQYPNDQIFIMLGEELENYYLKVYDGSHVLEGGLLVTAPRRNGYQPGNREFNKYESAVLASSQMKASQHFDFHYAISRVDRGWNIAIGMLMKYGVQVLPRAEARSNVDARQQTLFTLN